MDKGSTVKYYFHCSRSHCNKMCPLLQVTAPTPHGSPHSTITGVRYSPLGTSFCRIVYCFVLFFFFACFLTFWFTLALFIFWWIFIFAFSQVMMFIVYEFFVILKWLFNFKVFGTHLTTIAIIMLFTHMRFHLFLIFTFKITNITSHLTFILVCCNIRFFNIFLIV